MLTANFHTNTPLSTVHDAVKMLVVMVGDLTRKTTKLIARNARKRLPFQARRGKGGRMDDVMWGVAISGLVLAGLFYMTGVIEFKRWDWWRKGKGK